MKKVKLLLFLPAVILSACMTDSNKGEYYSLQGFTQGTTYHLSYQHPSENDLQSEIDSLLRAFDSSLSSYDSTSIISGINRNIPGILTDSLFRTVFRESRRVYQVTGGAFDITLAPLINAWGFGPGQQQDLDSAMVDSLLQYVGMEKVYLEGDKVIKSNPHVKLNVNAIAQGYAVDQVALFLENLGCRNYMIEIGGEIRTRGMNPKGNFWRIGVDRPEVGNMIPGDQLQVIISMRNRSLATSGNYRKFFEKDGVMITHSIDPATGFPKVSNLLSVSVLTEECMTADAYATACMVMGLEKALQMTISEMDYPALSTLNGCEAYFIRRLVA